MDVKKDVEQKWNKISGFNRIVSLFEISRPSRNRNGLHRTSSLPASSKRPGLQPSGGSRENSITSALQNHTGGKVKKNKGAVEEKSHQKEFTSTPKLTRKNHFKTAEGRKEELLEIAWAEDREKIMEDLNKLQEKIEDVTQEIQHSDTELEITFRNITEDDSDDVFESTSEISHHRLSSTDILTNRISSDTIEDICQTSVPKSDVDGEVSYTSYHRLTSSNSEDKEVQVDLTLGWEVYKVENSNKSELNRQCSQETDSSQRSFDADTENNSDNIDITENSAGTLDSIEWWKHKSFVQINTEVIPVENNSSGSTEKEDEDSSDPPQIGRFIKNNRSTRSEKRRIGLLQRPHSVRELTQQFEGFRDAAENGETETYRRSILDEMDKEIENMTKDGFSEDFHLSMENLALLERDDELSELNVVKPTTSEDRESSLFESVSIFPRPETDRELSQYNESDMFGEILFGEDIDNGISYVESYNADGKELVICCVQIDRQSVDLNSFHEIKTRPTSNMLANDESKLVLLGVADSSSFNDSASEYDSKRTTIYSTTSGESYEDEGIDIENTSYNSSAARRETYCDDQGVVRIERIAPFPGTGEEPLDYVNTVNNFYYSGGDDVTATEEDNYYESVRIEHEIKFRAPNTKKETLQYILEEIKSTERKYVSDMRKVLVEYRTFLEERCPEKVDVVFANMDHIYQQQLDFLHALEKADMNIQEVIDAFIYSEDLFRLYPRYFKNTPKANAAIKELSFLIQEKQQRIKDKLDLSAYLLTPLQRLGKYKLFLENIIKQLEKEQKPIGACQMALDIVKKYMSKGNDAVAIASILHSPLHTKDYGSFITREKFALIKPKRLDLMVFLFECVIVFATEDSRNMEQFVYHQSIKMIDLRIATFHDTTIHLTDYTKTKRRNSSKYTYVLDAKNTKVKDTWKELIEEILWKQMRKIKENTLKEYQSGSKALKKTPKRREQRSKSTGSSIFYVE